MNKRFLLPILIFCVGLCSAQESTGVYQERFEAIALKLWNNPELGYQETLSSELLKGILEDEGFSIIGNLADIPTAFRAVYGTVILVVTLFLATNDNTPFWYSIIFLLFSMVFSRILFKFIKSRWQKDQTDVVT